MLEKIFGYLNIANINVLFIAWILFPVLLVPVLLIISSRFTNNIISISKVFYRVYTVIFLALALLYFSIEGIIERRQAEERNKQTIIDLSIKAKKYDILIDKMKDFQDEVFQKELENKLLDEKILQRNEAWRGPKEGQET